MFRAVQNREMIRWVTVYDEGAVVNLFSCSASARKPGGAIAPVTAAIELPETQGIIRLTIAGSVLNEVGQWQIELVVNGENIEEPIPLFVRSLYERGPR